MKDGPNGRVHVWNKNTVDKKWFLIKILNIIHANIYFVAFQ